MYSIQTRPALEIVKNFKLSTISDIKKINVSPNEINTEYTLVFDIEIDKKNLILEDIRKAELYFSKNTPEELRNRSLTQDNASINSFNTSINRGNYARLQALKSFFSDSSMLYIDDIDMSFNVNNLLTKKIIDNSVSDKEIFGEIEEYKLADNTNFTSTSKIKTNYNDLISSTGYVQNLESDYNPKSIQKLNAAGLSIVGDQTSGLIKYINQEKINPTNFQKIAGNFNNIFYKNNRHPILKNLINVIKSSQSILSKDYFKNTNQKSIIVEKKINRIESLKKIVAINIDNINIEENTTAVIVLYDKIGIRKAVKMFSFNLDEVLDNYNYPNFDYEFSVEKQNKHSIYGSIYNNENVERSYVVEYQKKGENNLNVYNLNARSQYQKNVTIGPKSSKKFLLIQNDFGKSYCCYARIKNNEKVYGNSKISFSKGFTAGKKEKSTFIDFVCLNRQNGFEIIIRNLSYDDDKIILLKRNLTKKEKIFNQVVQIPYNDDQINISFIDIDVEDKDVYEYKIQINDKNGASKVSSNSFIEKYCRDLKLGELNFNISRSELSPKQHFINIKFSRTENDSNKLIRSLSGNFFNLFENALTELNDQAAIVIDVDVSIYNHTTGETYTTNILLDQQGEANSIIDLNVEKPNFPEGDYTYKVSPKLQLPSEIIQAIGAAKEEQLTGYNVPDTFLDKETGNIGYYQDFSYSQKFVNDQNLFNQKNVRLVKSETLKYNGKKKNNLYFDYYEAAFIVKNSWNLDYIIMSYSENNSIPTLYGIGYVPHIDNYQFYFSYKIPKIVGDIIFIGQPVFKNGKIGNPFIIGNLRRE